MATWSADAKEVPDDVRAALNAGPPLPAGPADVYVHVRAGLDSLLGDTHLILAGGLLRIASRGTSLDPLTEAVLTGRPTLDDSGYRNVLEIPTSAGLKKLEITALEEDAVEDLLRDLPPHSTPVAPPGAEKGERANEGQHDGAPEDEDGTEERDEGADADLGDDLHQARRALLRSLRTRVAQRRGELLLAKRKRRIGNVEVTLGQRRSPEERWKARHRHRHGSRHPEAASAPALGRQTLTDTLVRFALLALAAALVFGVFAAIGKAFVAVTR